MKVNVLGINYKVIIKPQREMRKARNYTDGYLYGYCDYLSKEIYLDKDIASDKKLKAHTLRHEILHAMAFESGLNTQVEWAQDEQCIDYYANQFPKMYALFKKLNILN